MYCLYRGDNVNDTIAYFLQEFGETSRTKPALKKKIGEVRLDLLSKLTDGKAFSVEQEKMGMFLLLSKFLLFSAFLALDFLSPAMLTKDDTALLVHAKEQWSHIAVGHNSTQVRFTLHKKPFTEADYMVEAKNHIVITQDLPSNYVVVDKVDTDTYKGLSLKLIELHSPSEDTWTMT